MNRKFTVLGLVIVYYPLLNKYFAVVFLLWEIGNDHYRLRRPCILIIVSEAPPDTLKIGGQFMTGVCLCSVHKVNAIPHYNIKSASEKLGYCKN